MSNIELDNFTVQQAQNLLSGLSRRVSWPMGSLLIARAGFNRARGWEKTIELLKDLANSEIHRQGWLQLQENFFQSVIYGNKAVRAFKVPSEKQEALFEGLKNLINEDSAAKSAFPYCAELEDLENEESLHFIYSDEADNGKLIIATQVATYTEQVEIPVDAVTQAANDNGTEVGSNIAQEENPSYDRVVGYRTRKEQLFHTIFFDTDNNALEIQTDNYSSLPTKDMLAIALSLRTSINNQAGRILGEALLDGTEINFFPLIDKFYEETTGRIVDLGFSTETGSIKAEKIRRSVNIDLRNEPYHEAGREALSGKLDIYRIGIRLPCIHSQEDHESEILLHSYVSELSEPSPELFQYSVYNVCDSDEYHNLRARIYKHLELDNAEKNG